MCSKITSHGVQSKYDLLLNMIILIGYGLNSATALLLQE